MKVVLCGLLMAATVACADAQTAPAGQAAQPTPPTSDTVVAEVGGRKITLKELDERWQALDPGEQARVTQLLYQNRRNVLDQMVGDALLEQAAKSAGMSSEQYLAEQSAKRQTAVTDADVQQFFDANKDRAQGRSLDDLKGPIREYLASQRKSQAKAQIIDDLKKASSGVRVMLDPPRQHVELAAHDPTRGPANAPITLVEFSDYQ